jgi:hypothetical protein
MKTRRVRITRLVREEVEITVHFMGGEKMGSYESSEDLFSAARQAGHPVKVQESFDTLSQYGYSHPADKPADMTVSSDGILVIDTRDRRTFFAEPAQR